VHKGERDPFVDAVLAEEGADVASASRDRWTISRTIISTDRHAGPEAHHAALELTARLPSMSNTVRCLTQPMSAAGANRS